MANKDLIIRIKVQDGQAKVQIEQIGKGFMNAKNAADLFRKAIQDQSPVLKGSVADYQRQIANLKLIRNNSAKTAEEFARQTKAITNLQMKMRSLTVETGDLNKVNQDQISNSGLAGATLTELGRTISDLPYGIRGVANNLSQLSTLFITLTAKTDGFRNSIKLLMTQLRGPLGYILAFQAVIALLDYFSNRQDKASESTEELANRFGESAAKLSAYEDILNDTNISQKEKAKVLKEVSEEVDGLNLELDKNNQLTEESNDLITKNIEKLKEQAETRAILDRLVELNTEKLQTEFDLRDKLGDKYESILYTLSQVGPTAPIFDALGLSGIDTALENLDDIEKEIQDLLERLRGRDLGVFDPDKEKGRAKKAKQIVDDFNTWYTKQRDKLEEDLAIDEVARLEAERFSASNSLIMMINDRKAKEKKALDDKLITKEEYDIRMLELDRLYLDKVEQLNNEYNTRIATAKLDQFLMNVERVSGAFDALYEAEISREERKTVLANNELKKRLRNEQLSADQRDAINKQIEINEENLQKKRDKLAERQFNIQKAANIASALSDTYRTGVLAFGSQLIIGDPTSPLRARIAQAVAIAAGLANVAAIARQKFVPSAISGDGGGGGGGGAGGGGIQAPDFNIVGASAQSQLAEAVGTAQSQPVRAFVVGKDISTQQELDRNITNTASFG